jgi:hypothetical protein
VRTLFEFAVFELEEEFLELGPSSKQKGSTISNRMHSGDNS